MEVKNGTHASQKIKQISKCTRYTVSFNISNGIKDIIQNFLIDRALLALS